MTRRALAAGVGVLLLAAACSAADETAEQPRVQAPADATPVADASASAPDVDPALLPTVERDTVPVRLAEGLAPPTNRWFSGLVFGAEPQPVFPLPVSVALTGTGFAYGLPQVHASGTLLAGGHAEQVVVDVGGPVEAEVTAYDAATVTVTLADDAGPVGRLHLVRGSPVVAWTALRDHEATLSVPFLPGSDDGPAVGDVGGRDHVLAGADPAADGRSVALAAGEAASFLVAPDGAPADVVAGLAAAAADPVVGAAVGYTVGADDVTTAVRYTTAGGGPAVVVRWPHQRDPADDADCSGTYATVRGTVEVCLTSTLAWRSPLREPVVGLDLSGLDSDERAALADQVRADAERSMADARPADTYFGGKAMARDANLWTLAVDLDLTDVAAALREDLVADLRTWLEPEGCDERVERCFTWDPLLATVVGEVPAFGSEEGNDHHFHYGYHLYAAGVLAADDPDLAAELAPVADLLAADVAAAADVGAGDGAPMPALRVLDVVMGHSWASGTAPFADGNNAESASEAVAAWHGLALWADASGDAGLADQARWMLSLEAASARAYWTDFDLDDPVAAGLEVSVTSLVWDGKRERATWFSAEPSAALGIVVLPVTGVSTYLGDDPERVRRNLLETLEVDDLWADPRAWDVLFGDQLLMYAGLLGPQDAASALEVARTLPDERVDDGVTRSWIEAWLYTRGA